MRCSNPLSGGFLTLLRRVWMWGALVGAILITRYLFDALAPVEYTPGVIHPRSSIMSYALMAIFVVCAARRAWRSGSVRSGVLVAFAAAVLGGAIGAAGTVVCLAMWHDPETLRAVQGSGGLAEALWGVPLLLMPIGLITGASGAIAGRLVRFVGDAVQHGM